MTFGWYRLLRYSQVDDEEQLEQPEQTPDEQQLESLLVQVQSGQPELQGEDVQHQVDENAANQFVDNAPPEASDEQVSQIIAEGALDASQKFSQLIDSMGLDSIGLVAGPSVAQSFLSSVINETLQRVQEQISAI